MQLLLLAAPNPTHSHGHAHTRARVRSPTHVYITRFADSFDPVHTHISPPCLLHMAVS